MVVTGSEFLNAWSGYCTRKGYPHRDGFAYCKSKNPAKSRARLAFSGLNSKKGIVIVSYYDKTGKLVKQEEDSVDEIMQAYNNETAWAKRNPKNAEKEKK